MTKKKILTPDEVMDKLLDRKKISELNIDLYDGKSPQQWEPEYQKAKKKWIADQLEWDSKGTTEQYEAKWDADHPGGCKDWLGRRVELNAHGEMQLVNKINEIIRELNKR